jgi:hypothetical protein
MQKQQAAKPVASSNHLHTLLNIKEQPTASMHLD